MAAAFNPEPLAPEALALVLHRLAPPMVGILDIRPGAA